MKSGLKDRHFGSEIDSRICRDFDHPSRRALFLVSFFVEHNTTINTSNCCVNNNKPQALCHFEHESLVVVVHMNIPW